MFSNVFFLSTTMFISIICIFLLLQAPMCMKKTKSLKYPAYPAKNGAVFKEINLTTPEAVGRKCKPFLRAQGNKAKVKSIINFDKIE